MKNILNISFRHFAALAVVLCAAGVADAASTFQKTDIDYTLDFSAYELGTTLAENGWTLSGAPHMTVTVPEPGGSGQNHVVKLDGTDNSATRRVALSPTLDFEPGYKLGDTIFLSAEIWATDIAESGAAIGLRNASGQDLAFIRVMDVNPSRRFAVKGTGSSYTTSEERGDAFTWYEVLLAIELDAEDITRSTGSVFIRDLSEPSSVLTAVADLQQINMGFTSTQNPLDIDFIRIENARGSAEFGNIQIGRGTVVIPEQSHVAMLMGVSMLALAWLKLRGSCKARN